MSSMTNYKSTDSATEQIEFRYSCKGWYKMNTRNYKELNNNEPSMGGLPGELSEEIVTQEKQKKDWRMNCDVGEATECLENEL